MLRKVLCVVVAKQSRMLNCYKGDNIL